MNISKLIKLTTIGFCACMVSLNIHGQQIKAASTTASEDAYSSYTDAITIAAFLNASGFDPEYGIIAIGPDPTLLEDPIFEPTLLVDPEFEPVNNLENENEVNKTFTVPNDVFEQAWKAWLKSHPGVHTDKDNKRTLLETIEHGGSLLRRKKDNSLEPQIREGKFGTMPVKLFIDANATTSLFGGYHTHNVVDNQRTSAPSSGDFGFTTKWMKRSKSYKFHLVFGPPCMWAIARNENMDVVDLDPMLIMTFLDDHFDNEMKDPALEKFGYASTAAIATANEFGFLLYRNCAPLPLKSHEVKEGEPGNLVNIMRLYGYDFKNKHHDAIWLKHNRKKLKELTKIQIGWTLTVPPQKKDLLKLLALKLVSNQGGKN